MLVGINAINRFILTADSEGHHFALPVSGRHSDTWIDCEGALRFLRDLPVSTLIDVTRAMLGISHSQVVFKPVKQDPLHVHFSNIMNAAFSNQRSDFSVSEQSYVQVLTAFDTVSGSGLRAAEVKHSASHPRSETRALVAFNLSENLNPTKAKMASFVHSPAQIWPAGDCRMCDDAIALCNL